MGRDIEKRLFCHLLNSIDPEEVKIGSLVTVRFEDGREIKVKIVEPGKINLKKTHISYQSPLGKAILGAHPGERRGYFAGKKFLQVEVIRIEKDEE